MLTLLILGALGLGGYYGYRRMLKSPSTWAVVARVVIFGEDRPR